MLDFKIKNNFDLNYKVPIMFFIVVKCRLMKMVK